MPQAHTGGTGCTHTRGQYTHMCTPIHISARVCTDTHTHTHTYTRTGTHIQTHTQHTHIQTHTHTNTTYCNSVIKLMVFMSGTIVNNKSELYTVLP